MTATAVDASVSSICNSIRQRVAELTGLPPAAIGATDPFSSLGIDSLLAAELAVDLGDCYGLDLQAAELFTWPTPAALARRIGELCGGESEQYQEDDRFARMRADARLPAHIMPARRSAPGVTAFYFITGATGFVGAHLVGRLLEATAARIVCLVRGGDVKRVREAMSHYGVSASDHDFARVSAVDGDLSRSHLGLSRADYEMVAEAADEILHCAAEVDWVRGYDALRTTNVGATLEVLGLACARKTKRVQLLSSLAVCYQTVPDRSVSESDHAIQGVEDLMLGYAQSKAVSESLVREAAAREIPARILRPALLAGSSASGISNSDDLLFRFMRGCIAMGLAPNLDWSLECLPVDDLVDAIVQLPAPALQQCVVHLSPSSSRSWRECVLWMRLRGYPLRLVDYATWAESLRRNAITPDHPLFALRAFFLSREGDGPYLPERFQNGSRARIESSRSQGMLASAGLRVQAISPALLGNYFDHMVEAGALSPAPGGSVARISGGVPSAPFAGLTEVLSMQGDDSIIAELTSWHAGRETGLFTGVFDDGVNAAREVVVKRKPEDRHVIDVAIAVASLFSETLGREFMRWREHLGFTRGHLRELAIYETQGPAFRKHTPEILARSADAERGEWSIVMERVVSRRREEWTAADLHFVLDGISALHAHWYGARAPMAESWLPPRRTAQQRIDMQDLWCALANATRMRMAELGGPALADIHAELAVDTARWGTPEDDANVTLIHNDFNPRNFVLRGEPGTERLCVFDWELARIGLPQRDIAELFCFTLLPSASATQVSGWIEAARQSMERAIGRPVDSAQWLTGFRASMAELLVDRFAMYAMLDPFRPQKFLPRVLQTWMRIWNAL